jgi:hypothetical protein
VLALGACGHCGDTVLDSFFKGGVLAGVDAMSQKFNSHWRLLASVKTGEMLRMKDSYVDLSAWQALSILVG